VASAGLATWAVGVTRARVVSTGAVRGESAPRTDAPSAHAGVGAVAVADAPPSCVERAGPVAVTGRRRRSTGHRHPCPQRHRLRGCRIGCQLGTCR
jgi:hypothetical protein